jgi:hypothetical protein
MSSMLQFVHIVAGLVVLAEALNKLERVRPFARGMRMRDRFVDGLKALAWLLLAMGAGGALAAPLLMSMGIAEHSTNLLMRLERPTLDQTMVLLGFAVLIVRTRVKEG